MAFGVGHTYVLRLDIASRNGDRFTNTRSSIHECRINNDRMPKDVDGVSLAPIGLGSIRELWLDFEIPTK